PAALGRRWKLRQLPTFAGNELAGPCLWNCEGGTRDLVRTTPPALACLCMAAGIQEGRLRAKRTLLDPPGYLCRPRAQFRWGRCPPALLRRTTHGGRNARQRTLKTPRDLGNGLGPRARKWVRGLRPIGISSARRRARNRALHLRVEWQKGGPACSRKQRPIEQRRKSSLVSRRLRKSFGAVRDWGKSARRFGGWGRPGSGPHTRTPKQRQQDPLFPPHLP